MKKSIYILLLLGLVAAAAFYKIKVLDKNKISTTAPAANAAAKNAPIAVQVLVAKKADISNALFASGTLLPNETTELRAETAGRITEILFSEGQFVRKDDLLLKINDADLQAQLQKNRHELTLARETETRRKKLVSAQASGAEEYDIALNRVNTLEADAQFLQAQIAKTQVFAPFDGIIGIRQIAIGAYMQPGTVIAPLRQTNPMKLEFSLPEKYLDKINKGSEVTFSLEGSDAKHSARVQLIDPQIDMETRSLRVRAVCANPNGKFLSGAFAKVQFPLQEKGRISVPSQAVVPTPKGKQVFLAKNGLAIPKEVTTGLRTEAEILVEGIQEGDTVIISGIMSMRPNAVLRIEEVKN